MDQFEALFPHGRGPGLFLRRRWFLRRDLLARSWRRGCPLKFHSRCLALGEIGSGAEGLLLRVLVSKGCECVRLACRPASAALWACLWPLVAL